MNWGLIRAGIIGLTSVGITAGLWLLSQDRLGTHIPKSGLAASTKISAENSPTLPNSNSKTGPSRTNKKMDELSQGLLQATLSQAQKITNPTEKFEVLTNLAVSYYEAQQQAKVNELLQQALATTKAISDPALRAKTLADLAGTHQTLKSSAAQIQSILTEATALANSIPANSPTKQKL